MAGIVTRLGLAGLLAVATTACGDPAAPIDDAPAAPAPPPAPPPPPPPPPPPLVPRSEPVLFNRIIFAKWCYPREVCQTSLWSMRPDGTDHRVLVDSTGWPDTPNLSPDGRTVVFGSWGALYLVAADGTGLRRLETRLSNSYHPSWSPHGDWIVFSAPDPATGIGQLYMVRPDGSEVRRVVATGWPQITPAWSPDGKWIAFSRPLPAENSLAANAPMLVDPATGVLVELPRGSPNLGAYNPAWSPDGSTIFFLGHDSRANFMLTRATLDPMTHELFIPARGNRQASVSPDGLRLVYGTGGLWIANIDGSNAVQVVESSPTTRYMEAYWAPAGPRP